jgi:hypothetical protein
MQESSIEEGSAGGGGSVDMMTSKKYFISPEILKGAKVYTNDEKSIFSVAKRANPLMTTTEDSYYSALGKQQRLGGKRQTMDQQFMTIS